MHWLKCVYKELPHKVVQYAIRVWDVEYNADDPLKTAEEGIKRLETFLTSIELPIRLAGLNIDNNRFDEMAERAVINGPIGNYKKLYSTDVKKIFELTV